jgi:hypothetical protein
VCPYCCQYRTTSKEGYEKHIKNCISGQAVEMPKEGSKISFKHFNNINECPIRIYADFESIKDISTRFKSKNEKTEQIKKTHLSKCAKLCKKYNLPIYDYYN